MSQTVTLTQTVEEKEKEEPFVDAKETQETTKQNKSKRAPKKTIAGVRKTRRWKPGTVAMREIRKYQKTTEPLIKKAPMARLIREIAQDIKTDLRFKPEAIKALHESAEMYIQELILNSSDILYNVNGRVTLKSKHMQCAKRIMDNSAHQSAKNFKR